MRNLAIIPARSGSKGVEDKNIKDLCGKPLIAYSIEAAIESECFDEVMVSTDSERYARIAVDYGASVPFLRSEHNSRDESNSWDMVEEVLQGYKEKSVDFDTFCLLQPTSPLRTSEDIRCAYSLFEENSASAVVSVCEAEHSPTLCGQLPDNFEFVDFLKPELLKRRQDLGKYYRLNGAIYLVSVERFEKNRFLYEKGSFAYVMDQMRSVDIDTELDFLIAQTIINRDKL